MIRVYTPKFTMVYVRFPCRRRAPSLLAASAYSRCTVFLNFINKLYIDIHSYTFDRPSGR